MAVGLGIIMALLNPLLGGIYATIAISRDPRHRRVYVIILAILGGIIAYNLVPTKETSDLSRYFYWIDNYFRGASFEQIYDTYHDQGLFFMQSLIYYLVSLTSNNQLLPFGVMLVATACNLNVVTGLCNKYGVNLTKGLVLYFCLMPFPVADLGVRTVLSFALVSLAMFRDLEEGKRGPITWVLYVLALSIHVAGLALILIRLIGLFWQHSANFRLSVPLKNILLVAGMLMVVVGLFKLGVLDVFMTKSSTYFSGGNTSYLEYLDNSLYMKLIRFFYLVVFGYALVMLWYLRKTIKMSAGVINFVLILLVALASFVSQDTVFMRFAFIVPTFLPYLFVRRRAVPQTRRLIYANWLLAGLCVGGVLIQLTYLGLNTQIGMLIGKTISTSIIQVILSLG